MLNRLDDALEPIARLIGGKAQWDEMKENATLATTGQDGAMRKALMHLADVMRADRTVQVHVVGHSAGSIFHAPVVQMLSTDGPITGGPMDGETGLGLPITTCALWAPACTVDLFKQAYVPAIRSGAIGRFSLFALSDQAEQDDHCANVYHKSLLYLVSNAFEAEPHVPILHPTGVPILGMEKFIRDGFKTTDRSVAALFRGTTPKADLVVSPNTEKVGSEGASRSMHHGDFDDDDATVRATFARILPKTKQRAGSIRFVRSASSLRESRKQLQVRP
jgi:hypothetical protein